MVKHIVNVYLICFLVYIKKYLNDRERTNCNLISEAVSKKWNKLVH